MTRLARFVSVFLHPLLMPLYAMLVMLFATQYGLFLNMSAVFFLIGIVFFFTCFVPLLYIIFLRKIGLVSSFSIQERRRRVNPLLFGGFMCYICYMVLVQIRGLDTLFPEMFYALTLFLVLLAIITLFWKISLHMAAIGGLLTIVFVFTNSFGLFLVIILLAGLLGTARLQLQAHSPTQIYVGFALGVCYFTVFFFF